MEVEQAPRSRPASAASPAGAASAAPVAAQVFTEGLGYLRGTGSSGELRMAAVRLLQASEMGLAIADMYCALLYFCGVGVTRSLPSAIDHAARYLVAEPFGPFASAARGLAVGSLSAEHARRLLFDGASRCAPVRCARPRRVPRSAIAAGIGAVIAVAAAAAAFLG